MHFQSLVSFALLGGAVAANVYGRAEQANSNNNEVRQPQAAAGSQPTWNINGRRNFNGRRNLGYYPNYDIYARNFTVLDIPHNQLTHISYAFANVNATTGEVYLSDEFADLQKAYPGDVGAPGNNVLGAIKQLYLMKKKDRSLKTLLLVGGYTYSPNFITPLASEKSRQLLATSAVKIMADCGFDGIDVDYEYVTTAAQAKQVVDMMKKLRQAMNDYTAKVKAKYPKATLKSFLLSYCLPAGPEYYKVIDYKGMEPYVDFWNYLGFDFTGGFSTIAGFQDNLFNDKSNPSATPFNTSQAINYYTNEGCVPPAKINLGNPLYGHAFNNTDGPGRPFDGVGTAGSFGGEGIFNVNDLPKDPNAVVKTLPLVGASYSYDAKSRYMISFDTPEVVAIKGAYILAKGIGGSMFYEMSMDNQGKNSLVKTMVDTLGGFGALDKSQNTLDYPLSVYDNLRAGFPGETSAW